MDVNNILNIYRIKKITISVLAGLICLFFSGYGIVVQVDQVSINLVWTVVFPLMVSMAYGGRYGLIAGLSGGAIFPWIIWAGNGYANILTFLLLLALYYFAGRLNLANIYQKYRIVLSRIFFFMLIYCAVMGVCYLYLFNLLLSYNPPFWRTEALDPLETNILIKIFLKSSVNYLFAVISAEMMLHLPLVRRILGLSEAKGVRENHKIIGAGILVSSLIITIFIILDNALVKEGLASYLLMVVTITILSSIMIVRVLINYMEKRLEVLQTLDRQDKNLRLIFENNKDAILWADVATGIIIRCNKAATRLFKRSAQELVGMHFTGLHPQHMMELYSRTFNEFIRTENLSNIYEIVDSNGEIRQVEIFSSVIEIDTQSIVQGIFVDVSERNRAQQALKTSEARQSAMIANISDVIAIVDKEATIRYKSSNIEKWFGWKSVELIGQCAWDNIHPEDHERVVSFFEQKKNDFGATFTLECRYKCKNGEYKWIEATATNCLEDPNIEGILVNYKDISERKKTLRLEQEIVIARNSAEFKQKFLANMSHEIRTPLTGVLGMADILSNTRLDENQKDYLDTLMQSGENLREIINLILDYSKIEAGRVQLKKHVFPLQEILSEAHKLYNSIGKKEIEFETYIDPDIPSFIQTDKHRLSQVIRNLLSNAVKFTQQGHIGMKATLVQKTDNNAIIRFDISDTGRGIPADKLGKIFTPFYQVEDNNSRIAEGTGLGLPICNELVTLLGGNLGVESVTNKGSNFWFTINVFITDFPQNITVDTQNIIVKPLRILVVDDKIVNQKVISLLFSSHGHQVTLASNGQHALEEFKPGLFDLILIDIQMPVMDGITATINLRRKYTKLPPIVGLSANAFEGDREKYMKLGLDEYLTKPLNIVDFNKVLVKLELNRNSY
jgi:PAS domain S-box-containing protein